MSYLVSDVILSFVANIHNLKQFHSFHSPLKKDISTKTVKPQTKLHRSQVGAEDTVTLRTKCWRRRERAWWDQKWSSKKTVKARSVLDLLCCHCLTFVVMSQSRVLICSGLSGMCFFWYRYWRQRILVTSQTRRKNLMPWWDTQVTRGKVLMLKAQPISKFNLGSIKACYKLQVMESWWWTTGFNLILQVVVLNPLITCQKNPPFLSLIFFLATKKTHPKKRAEIWRPSKSRYVHDPHLCWPAIHLNLHVN